MVRIARQDFDKGLFTRALSPSKQQDFTRLKHPWNIFSAWGAAEEDLRALMKFPIRGST